MAIDEQSPTSVTSVTNEYSFAADEIEEQEAAEGKNGRRRKALCQTEALLPSLASAGGDGAGRIWPHPRRRLRGFGTSVVS